MDDQRRVVLAFLLMALVLIASQWWFAATRPPADETAPRDTTAGAPGDTSKVVEAMTDTVPAGGVSREPEGPVPAGPAKNTLLAGRPAPRAIMIETPLYRAIIDPQGGGVRQIELFRYPSYTRRGAVELVPEGGEFLRRVADLGDLRLPLHSYVFAASDTAIRLAAGDPARTLDLAHSAGGRRIVQSYRFDPGQYAIDYRLDLGGPLDGVLVTGLGPRLRSNEKNPREDYRQLRAVARVDGQIVSREASDVDQGEVLAVGGAIDWAGLRNKYFLGMLLAPPEGPPLSAATISGAGADSLPSFEIAIGTPIEDGASGYRLYFGPQEYRQLTALNEDLDDVNQYGWSWIRWMITPFAKLIVVIMLWLHRFIPSYGLVLIVFGLLVRVASWPLTTKSYRSIQAMQELQPEIQRIRERHKKDPQKMQQETMRLYREKKVNPMGGCLPNLIPMPILFALFFVFQSTIELRGQPFLWLPDLSQPDPLYILPIFMGLTMMASSRLTTTDPKMAAMTYLMPIVLTFVFLNLAAGLVLYYAFSNVLTFGQQWWMKRGAEKGASAESGEGP
jgi:YidC/Oxa1 family membrane protein insertase